MTIDKKEVRRYLGYTSQHYLTWQEGDAVDLLIEQCIKEISKLSDCRYTSRRFDLDLSQNNVVCFDRVKIQSKNLYTNLKDCTQIILLACTLGPESDRILQRYSRIDITKAVVFQATAAAAIEAYCDEVQEIIESEIQKEGFYIKPRYSPGYGDVSLDVQKDFLSLIGSTSTVGITLSEGNLMIPEKSITAFIGLTKTEQTCHKKGCQVCGKTDCLYRRN